MHLACCTCAQLCCCKQCALESGQQQQYLQWAWCKGNDQACAQMLDVPFALLHDDHAAAWPPPSPEMLANITALGRLMAAPKVWSLSQLICVHSSCEDRVLHRCYFCSAHSVLCCHGVAVTSFAAGTVCCVYAGQGGKASAAGHLARGARQQLHRCVQLISCMRAPVPRCSSYARTAALSASLTFDTCSLDSETQRTASGHRFVCRWRGPGAAAAGLRRRRPAVRVLGTSHRAGLDLVLDYSPE